MMEKGRRRTAPSATARVKVQSSNLPEGQASPLGQGSSGCPSPALPPSVTSTHRTGCPGWGRGNGTSRNLRNLVDSSILVIVNCGDKIPKQRVGGGGAAHSIAPCPSSPPSKCYRNPPRETGLCSQLGSNWQAGCGRTRAPGGGQKQGRNRKNPREAECGCQGLPGPGSSLSLTCCEIRVLLKVGYDEVAEDVEAGKEQGTDLWAEEGG